MFESKSQSQSQTIRAAWSSIAIAAVPILQSFGVDLQLSDQVLEFVTGVSMVAIGIWAWIGRVNANTLIK